MTKAEAYIGAQLAAIVACAAENVLTTFVNNVAETDIAIAVVHASEAA